MWLQCFLFGDQGIMHYLPITSIFYFWKQYYWTFINSMHLTDIHTDTRHTPPQSSTGPRARSPRRRAAWRGWSRPPAPAPPPCSPPPRCPAWPGSAWRQRGRSPAARRGGHHRYPHTTFKRVLINAFIIIKRLFKLFPLLILILYENQICDRATNIHTE